MEEAQFLINDFLENRRELEDILNIVSKKQFKYHKNAFLLKELLTVAIKNFKKDTLKYDLEKKKNEILNKIQNIEKEEIKKQSIGEKKESVDWNIKENGNGIPGMVTTSAPEA